MSSNCERLGCSIKWSYATYEYAGKYTPMQIHLSLDIQTTENKL